MSTNIQSTHKQISNTYPKITICKSELKNIIVLFSATIICLLSILSAITTLIINKSIKNQEQYYALGATVVSVNPAKNRTIYVDSDGNMWEEKGLHYQWNDNVVLKMSDNGTPNNNIDDKIVSVIR